MHDTCCAHIQWRHSFAVAMASMQPRLAAACLVLYVHVPGKCNRSLNTCAAMTLHMAKSRMLCVVQDLTTSERDYIRRKLGPDNFKWAKAALKMADKMGPMAGGEIFHDCDCKEFSCFCGKVTQLGGPDVDFASEGSGQGAGSDSRGGV